MNGEDHKLIIDRGVSNLYTILENGFERSMSIINKKKKITEEIWLTMKF